MKYDKKYFDWQKNIGAFGGIANKFKFEDFIQLEYNVLDFGCGGGYLLVNSTSIFEGIYFGCIAIVLKIEGYQALDWLVERGLCTLVDSESAWELPEEKTNKGDYEDLFLSRPLNVNNVLVRIS